MKKNIIIIIALIVVVGVGYYFFSERGQKTEEDFFTELLEYQSVLSSDRDLIFSELEDYSLPEINMDLGFDLPKFEFSGAEELGLVPVPEISFDHSLFNVSFPEMDFSSFVPPTGTSPETEDAPPATWTPNASDCAGFAAAPNCSYVPPANRDMCEQCKAAGF